MEAFAEHVFSSGSLTDPQGTTDSFFLGYGVEVVYDQSLHLFRGWVCQAEERKHCSDKEMAVFLDQLINLVAASAALHGGNAAVIGEGKAQ